MKQHYKKGTVEIDIKFFKCIKCDNEEVAEYVVKFLKLDKTCSSGDYLDTALRNQLVCGLHDQKT